MVSGPHELEVDKHGYARQLPGSKGMSVTRVALTIKTVIIAYITIPSLDAFPASARLPDGGLDPRKFNMQSLMAHYSVREVSLVSQQPGYLGQR